MLGPFLDSYHSAFGVLQYDDPIMIQLWGTAAKPALTTAWWVPELFGLAGFLIGWLYILLDAKLETPDDPLLRPSPPKILYCISFFTLQYWLSGILYGLVHLDRGLIGTAMQLLAIAGFFGFDRTRSGVVTSLATAIGGPLIEVLLISTLQGHGGYHYTDPGETGFFPLWIAYGKSKHGQRRNEKERERERMRGSADEFLVENTIVVLMQRNAGLHQLFLYRGLSCTVDPHKTNDSVHLSIHAKRMH